MLVLAAAALAKICGLWRAVGRRAPRFVGIGDHRSDKNCDTQNNNRKSLIHGGPLFGLFEPRNALASVIMSLTLIDAHLDSPTAAAGVRC